jgi:hypothetical protein
LRAPLFGFPYNNFCCSSASSLALA